MEKQYLRWVLASLCMIGFLLILILVVTGHAAGFDDPIRQFFYGLRSDGLTPIIVALTQASNKYVIIVLCLVLLIIPQTRMPFGVPLSAGALGTILLNTLLKHLIGRPRPEVLHLVTEHGPSFPSGHSINSMFFYGMAIWLIWHYCHYTKKTTIALTVLCLIFACLVGPTRIYLGVHYPTDVLAGWFLAWVAIAAESAIILKLEQRRLNIQRLNARD